MKRHLINIGCLALVLSFHSVMASTLNQVSWNANSYYGSLSGHLLYVTDNEISYRIEATVESDSNLLIYKRLLQRDGKGWTITPSKSGGAVVLPWSGKYFELEGAQLEFCDILLEILETPEVMLDSLQFQMMEPFYMVGSRPIHNSSILNRMSARGTGRGDMQERLLVSYNEEKSIIKISSDRTPVTLTISRIDSYSVPDGIEMLYVPVWSLEKLILENEQQSGTIE
jgi:hypothetical protein